MLKPDPHILKVKEYFTSLQGEGMHQGKLAAFMRFVGCNLRCSWCDTKYHSEKPFTEMNPKFAAELLIGENTPMVVLTGGEPLIQDKDAFTELLGRLAESPHIQWIGIETNGTIPFNKHVNNSFEVVNKLWVTVSPKPDSDYKIWVTFPDEVKIVEDETVTPDLLHDIARSYHQSSCLVLQPKSNESESMLRCMELIKLCPQWILRLQMHRILALR